MSFFHRVIQAQTGGQIQHSFSLPAAMPLPKTVSFSDEYGINHDFNVNDAIWDHVCALVENTQGSGSTPVFRFGIYHRPSTASLQSTVSQASSQTSGTSTGSQPAGTGADVR